MTDYELFLALVDEYKSELKKRKDGEEVRVWDSKKKVYEAQKFRPANKARLQRLRLELSRLMLQMERKMEQFSPMDKKEGWE